jgi:hypothetical protein
MGDDFVYGLLFAGLGVRFGQVEAGDLEAVEEEAGAAGVDAVVRDAEKDLADGVLDGGAVFRAREGELGAAAFAGLGFGLRDGLAAGVVVEAKKFLFERR